MDRKPQAAGLKLKKDSVLPLILAALKEDVGPRDLTTQFLLPKETEAKADLLVRQKGVIAGLQVAEWTFALADPKIRFKPNVQEGDPVNPGKAVAFLEGPARGILIAERTALNFLGRLSGIATLTRAFVEKVKPYPARILDTRKTTPGLRLLEKYAVAVGGGTPHRMGLYDQVLVKENHLKLLAGSSGGPPSSFQRISAIERAVKLVRERLPGRRVEVEVTSLKEFRQALGAKADILLLDNLKLSEIQEAVRLARVVSRSVRQPKVLLEVSGGVTLENVEKIASTGVDRISVGALTHSAPALDVALEVVG